MTVAAGARLGPYEIQSALGAGGMGEVYRALDTTLGRQVAIKIVPDAFAHDPERLVRFEREAKTLASLNHPNIAQIYGFEKSSSVHALVMELIEGPTLADRIADVGRVPPSKGEGPRGGIPIDEALSIARQIAEALEAAHERGIIHRDLKPANVKVRADGTVKVLDFGLAKAFEGEAAAANASNSPTLSVAATRMGVILGTAAYMAPEQAKGKAVDRRADIWGFGCVLFEMLSGQPPFRGETVSETLAEVMKSEPLWDVLPAGLPARVVPVLRRCLEKDPTRRVRDIGDVRLALEGAFDAPVGTQNAAVSVAPPAPLWRRAVVPVVTLFAGAVIAGGGLWTLSRPEAPRVTRLTISTPGNAALTIDGTVRDLAITPDGTRVVYVGADGSQLLARALDALEPTVIAKGALRNPFVSPDGQWVGFFDSNIALKKVSITGGPAVTVAAIESTPRGATWLPDDTIVFATSNVTTGLRRVAAAGGTPTVVTRPDRAQGELDHWWPEVLPGGRSVLFTIMARTGGPDAAQVAVLDLETTTYKVLVRGGSDAHYATTGHLVYGTSETLRAVAFDLVRLETRGTPVPVVSEVLTTSSGAMDAVVAADGVLAYVSGGVGSVQRILMWVDRQGRETSIPVPPRPYSYPRITPDGKRIALYVLDQENDLWLWDLERTTLTRATFEPGIDAYPVWTPDARRLIFSSDRAGGNRNLYWQAADGTGTVERLFESDSVQDPSAVSPDGTRVILHENTAANGLDLMELHLDDGSGSFESSPAQQRSARRVTPLVQTPFSELNGSISPDGRWLAYQANDSGRFEIYVRPYLEVSRGLWQVSTGGGSRPAWSRTGQELFYVSPAGALMRVGVERGPTWAASAPTKLLNEGYFTVPGGQPGRTYDISPDGQRFLMIKAGGGSGQAAAPQIVIVQNWLEELKRLVPVD